MASEKQPVLQTPIGICSYPNLVEARQGTNKGSKPKFRTAIEFTPELLKKHKDAKAKLKALKQSALACAESKWGTKARTLIESGKLNWPFRSMDDEDPDDTNYSFPDGTEWIQPSTVGRPGTVDRYEDPDNPGKPVKIEVDDLEEKIYAGCHIRATVRAYWYDNQGNKGVAFALNNIQKVAEGERLDGRKKASDEFEALEDADDMPDADDEAPRRRKKSRAAPPPEDDEDDEEDVPVRRKKSRKVEEDDDQDDGDEDEEDEPPARRKKSRKVEEDDDSDDDDGDEEDDEPAPRRRGRASKSKKRTSLDDVM